MMWNVAELLNWCFLHVHTFNNVTRASLTNSTLFYYLRIKEILDSIRSNVCWQSNFVQHLSNHSTVQLDPFFQGLKRRPHVKRMLANSCWQTQIGVSERHNNTFANYWRKVGENRDKFYLSLTVCQHETMNMTQLDGNNRMTSEVITFNESDCQRLQHVVPFTHTNLGLLTRVGQH